MFEEQGLGQAAQVLLQLPDEGHGHDGVGAVAGEGGIGLDAFLRQLQHLRQLAAQVGLHVRQRAARRGRRRSGRQRGRSSRRGLGSVHRLRQIAAFQQIGAQLLDVFMFEEQGLGQAAQVLLQLPDEGHGHDGVGAVAGEGGISLDAVLRQLQHLRQLAAQVGLHVRQRAARRDRRRSGRQRGRSSRRGLGSVHRLRQIAAFQQIGAQLLDVFMFEEQGLGQAAQVLLQLPDEGHGHDGVGAVAGEGGIGLDAFLRQLQHLRQLAAQVGLHVRQRAARRGRRRSGRQRGRSSRRGLGSVHRLRQIAAFQQIGAQLLDVFMFEEQGLGQAAQVLLQLPDEGHGHDGVGAVAGEGGISLDAVLRQLQHLRQLAAQVGLHVRQRAVPGGGHLRRHGRRHGRRQRALGLSRGNCPLRIRCGRGRWHQGLLPLRGRRRGGHGERCPHQPVALRDDQLLAVHMQGFAREQHAFVPFVLQHLTPAVLVEAWRARDAQGGVVVFPPAVQQPERHMAEQGLVADFIQDQQTAGPQRRLHVAEGLPDVLRGVQDIGRDDHVEATRLDALPLDGFLGVEDLGLQEGRDRRIVLPGMHEEGMGEIGIDVLLEGHASIGDLAQKPGRRPTGPGADFQHPERAWGAAGDGQHGVMDHLVEQVGLAVALVQPFHQGHAGAREHDFRGELAPGQDVGQGAQADLGKLHGDAPVVVLRPPRCLLFPVRPGAERRGAGRGGHLPGLPARCRARADGALLLQDREALLEPAAMPGLGRLAAVEEGQHAPQQGAGDQRIQLRAARFHIGRALRPVLGTLLQGRVKGLQGGRLARRGAGDVAVVEDPLLSRTGRPAHDARAKRLEHGHLGQAAGKQRLQSPHALVGLDGPKPGGRHALPVAGIADDADAPPVAPVHHLHREGQRPVQPGGEGILEGASGRIVGLPGRLSVGRDRREEHHEVQRIGTEDRRHLHADIRLGTPG